MHWFCAVREIARLITKPGESPNKIIFQEHFGDVPAASNEEAAASIKRNASGVFLSQGMAKPAGLENADVNGPAATQAYDRRDSMQQQQMEESKNT